MGYRRPFLTLLLAVLVTYLSLALVHGTLEPFGYLGWGDSMHPQLEAGDVYVQVDPHRFSEPYAVEGVVTAAAGASRGYTSFGAYGDVVVFLAEDDQRWVHRTVTYVEPGDEWKGRNGSYVADNEGFITAGDNNSVYDQEPEIGLDPVPPEDVHVKLVEPPGDPSLSPVLDTWICRQLDCPHLPAPRMLYEDVTSGL